MFSADKYISTIKSNLEKQSDIIIRNLKNIFTCNFSSEIDLLDFSAFIEPTRLELSIRMFSMDKEANEVFYEGDDTTVFAGSVEILNEVKYSQVNESHLDEFFDFYEQNYETLISEERKAFTEWFSQCWKNACGDELNIPSYFVFHDDYRSFDLKNNKWIDDEEKWS
ncbi:hypothetical protein J5Y03_02625 [Bacillus sp. RG28]|uniref:Uncharacterized protein n=1 Tax=Gottfriedia endophytica TaxID=2820819 RepID=A0A940NNQ0_9BACI|nr:hypothetical protein [Gottfriedia endophytica]MBP0724076.1 hypothetical protein [Gottfriedia endophytica]